MGTDLQTASSISSDLISTTAPTSGGCTGRGAGQSI
jgi:hypothetical protein